MVDSREIDRSPWPGFPSRRTVLPGSLVDSTGTLYPGTRHKNLIWFGLGLYFYVVF